MTSPVVRSLSSFAVATAIVALSAGSVAAGSAATEPLAAAPGCPEITLALDAVDAFGFAFATGDIDTARLLLTELPEIGEEAVAAAPDDIAETVETWVAPLPLIVAAIAGVDPSDPDAFEQAVNAIDSRSSETARREVQAWAEFNCGWTSALVAEQIEAPEPPECEVLDASAAAQAAGIDVDVTDLDGSADVSLPGFWTKSCSYGNGAMSLSTLSFNTVEDAQRFYADNLELSDGVVLDVDLGSLPESSLVIQTGVTTGTSTPATDEPDAAVTPTVQVSVFEAPIPFSVSFSGADVDPAAVVAAAEAVLAAPAGTEPPATDVATTA